MAENRSDSAHIQTAIMQEALAGIRPPAGLELRPQDEKFWKMITEARAQWTDVDLVHAYNLARTFADIMELRDLIDIEGYTTPNANGGVSVHPNVRILETLMGRATSLSSKIQVHAAATIGEVENTRKKNALKQSMVKTLQEMDDDDLLGKPAN